MMVYIINCIITFLNELKLVLLFEETLENLTVFKTFNDTDILTYN